MANQFAKYAEFYDIFYKEKDYLLEANYLINLLKTVDIVSGEVLEFGCGTGQHARIIAERGFSVHGIEMSSEMLARCKKSNHFTFEQGDIRKISLNKTFDSVISLFHVFSYMQSNEDVNLFFKSAHKHLDPGGKLIFDFWYSPAVYHQGIFSTNKSTVVDDNIIIKKSNSELKLNENIVEVKFSIKVKNKAGTCLQRFKESHILRHFSLPEIKLVGSFHGFDFVTAEEVITGKSPSEDSFSVIAIFEKR
jgi:SAM-dependent methyltransferase